MPIATPSPARFYLERWIQRGVFRQLLLMAGLVALVAAAGGCVAWLTTDAFEALPTAIWWAFLRLTDPGYLGDDEGLALRIISTVVTVLGYVLFMGSMIAIMTQWLALTLRELESGATPISMRHHVVILGWTNRTPEVVLKLLGAQGRLRRFLEGRDTRKLRVVILATDASAARRRELQEHLGKHWSSNQVFLRSGSSLKPEHLERLDLGRASVILVPGEDFELGGSEMTDTRVVKTLLTLGRQLRSRPADSRPHIVAEIFDPHLAPIARSAIEHKLEVVASNRIISRLMSQSVRHRGLAEVLFGILSHRQGNSLYVRALPELAGSNPWELSDQFQGAILLGFLRPTGGQLRACMDATEPSTLEEDDLLIFLAPRYDECLPGPATGAPDSGIPPRPVATRGPSVDRVRKILVLGWSHKVGAFITELDQDPSGRFDLTIMSRTDLANREQWLARLEWDPERIRVHNTQGDYAIESELVAQRPQDFDHVILFASDWMDSSEAADARTILGYTLLDSLMNGVPESPEVLVELLDPDNSNLFEESRDVILVTPRVLSHLLAHVALRPELNAVYDELFRAGGSEIQMRPAATLELPAQAISFETIQRAARDKGLIVLGLIRSASDSAAIQLNPRRDQTWELSSDDKVIVLASAAGAPSAPEEQP